MKKIRKHSTFNFTKYCSLDTETTGFLMYEGDYIFSYSITNWYGESLVLRFDNEGKAENLANREVLQKFLYDTTIVKIMHKAMFDVAMLRSDGFIFPEFSIIHDTMIMSQFLNNIEVNHSLDNLAVKHFKYPTDQDTVFKKIISAYKAQYKKDTIAGLNDGRTNKSGYNTVPVRMMDKYQIADGERAMLLYQFFSKELFKDKRMWDSYLIDIELVWVSIDMEAAGLRLQEVNTKRLIKKFTAIVTDTNKKIKKILGYELNVNSPQQVCNLIYDEMGNKCTKFSKKRNKKTGEYGRSSDKDVIVELRDRSRKPIFDLILKERAYKKGISDLSSYLKIAHPITRRMHPSIHTNRAVTGRQSISDPPLQCVAKEVSVKSVYGIPARQCFCADPGTILILSDYAGIELRLIVESAQEDEMIEIINAGGDVHDTASEEMYKDNWHEINLLIDSPAGVKVPRWLSDINPHDYKEDYSNVRYMMRGGVKGFEFGIAYGGGFDAITGLLFGLTKKEKTQAYKRFCKRWPGIAYFTDNIIATVKKHGYITNAFGRKLYIERGREYAGSNYIVQSTAAYILKIAQVRIHQYLKYELNNMVTLKISVHDELIKAYARSLLPDIGTIMPKIWDLMTDHKEIRVKLEVESEYTTSNWAAAKKLNLKDFVRG